MFWHQPATSTVQATIDLQPGAFWCARIQDHRLQGLADNQGKAHLENDEAADAVNISGGAMVMPMAGAIDVGKLM